MHAKLIKTTDPTSGRNLAKPFCKLPSEKRFPDYYKTIKNPIELLTIEEDLSEGRYVALKAYVSDVSRVFNNAVRFNKKGSLISTDAILMKQKFNKDIRACRGTIDVIYVDDEEVASSPRVATPEVDQNVIHCICRRFIDEGKMIQCENPKCAVWEHTACVGVLEGSDTPHRCQDCRPRKLDLEIPYSLDVEATREINVAAAEEAVKVAQEDLNRITPILEQVRKTIPPVKKMSDKLNNRLESLTSNLKTGNKYLEKALSKSNKLENEIRRGHTRSKEKQVERKRRMANKAVRAAKEAAKRVRRAQQDAIAAANASESSQPVYASASNPDETTTTQPAHVSEVPPCHPDRPPRHHGPAYSHEMMQQSGYGIPPNMHPAAASAGSNQHYIGRDGRVHFVAMHAQPMAPSSVPPLHTVVPQASMQRQHLHETHHAASKMHDERAGSWDAQQCAHATEMHNGATASDATAATTEKTATATVISEAADEKVQPDAQDTDPDGLSTINDNGTEDSKVELTGMEDEAESRESAGAPPDEDAHLPPQAGVEANELPEPIIPSAGDDGAPELPAEPPIVQPSEQDTQGYDSLQIQNVGKLSDLHSQVVVPQLRRLRELEEQNRKTRDAHKQVLLFRKELDAAEKKLERQMAPSEEALAIAIQRLDQVRCVYFRTIVVHGLQFRLGDCVYVSQDQHKRASARARHLSPIYRIEKLWRDADGKAWGHGHKFWRIEDTHVKSGQKFFDNELAISSLVESFEMETVLGVCWVMRPKAYLQGRPTECTEEGDAWVVEFRYTEHSKSWTKLKSGRDPWPTPTHPSVFRDFMQPSDAVRRLRCEFLSTQNNTKAKPDKDTSGSGQTVQPTDKKRKGKDRAAENEGAAAATTKKAKLNKHVKVADEVAVATADTTLGEASSVCFVYLLHLVSAALHLEVNSQLGFHCIPERLFFVGRVFTVGTLPETETVAQHSARTPLGTSAQKKQVS